MQSKHTMIGLTNGIFIKRIKEEIEFFTVNLIYKF